VGSVTIDTNLSPNTNNQPVAFDVFVKDTFQATSTTGRLSLSDNGSWSPFAKSFPNCLPGDPVEGLCPAFIEFKVFDSGVTFLTFGPSHVPDLTSPTLGTTWIYVGYLEPGVQVHQATASLIYLDVAPRDTDSDGIPDVSDNCPFVPNNSQTNSDSQSAGDVCQCGDVNNDFIVNGLDVQIARENLVGSTLSGSFDPERCNVIGTSDCGVDDIFVLDRVAKGLPVSLQNICDAYTAP
jgi:hypothetical protein